LSNSWSDLEVDDFSHPYHRALFEAISSAGTPADVSIDAVIAAVPPAVGALVPGLAVEALAVAAPPDERLAAVYVVSLRELTALRRIDQVKARLQRTNPVTEVAAYNRMFGELIALESHRRALREQAVGSAIG
jgi:DNA primase